MTKRHYIFASRHREQRGMPGEVLYPNSPSTQQMSMPALRLPLVRRHNANSTPLQDSAESSELRLHRIRFCPGR